MILGEQRDRTRRILGLIGSGKLESALSALFNFAVDFSNDRELINAVLVLRGDFANLRGEQKDGLVTSGDATARRNTLCRNALEILGTISEGAYSSHSKSVSYENLGHCLELIREDEKKGGLELLSFALQNLTDQRQLFPLVYQTFRLQNDPPELESILERIGEITENEPDANEEVAEVPGSSLSTPEIPNGVILIDHLIKSYRSKGFRLELGSYSFRAGEVIGVVGRNGSGKTTFLRLLAGKIQPGLGKLRYPTLHPDGDEVDWYKVKESLAHIPQELPRWYGSLVNNLKIACSVRGIKGKTNQFRVATVIQRLGLQEHLDKRWGELSGGYKLRFSLAKELVWKPSILLLDEPLGNLDVITKKEFMQDLRDLARSVNFPMTVVICSHDLREIEDYSDRVLVLKEGKAAYFGELEGIKVQLQGRRLDIRTLDLEKTITILEKANFRYRILDGRSLSVHLEKDHDMNSILGALIQQGIRIQYFEDRSDALERIL